MRFHRRGPALKTSRTRRSAPSLDVAFMREALRLARRAYGETSPNPLVGAILVRRGVVLGRGWHRRAGEAHAEIEALREAQRRRHRVQGATLYVTLEPCCTLGRTPPCTDAIVAAGVCRVVAGATDPNPLHAGRGFRKLRRAGLEMVSGVLAEEATQLNESFNHWIVHRTPFVTVKAAMTLDGKIATAAGDSKWITGTRARGVGMQLRRGADAILVGVNTIVADNPSLTVRPGRARPLRRFVLDTLARTPPTAKVVTDDQAAWTTVVVGPSASARRVRALSKHVTVVRAPLRRGQIDVRWLLRRLGREDVTSLLVEGGGEVNASFLIEKLAQRVVFFYAPKILGGRDARKAVGGENGWSRPFPLREVIWRRLGSDLFLTARLGS